jgi:opacity protein-like surface antigen
MYRESRRREGEGTMKRFITFAVTLAAVMSLAVAAIAVPRLQTYIVGSSYHSFYQQEFNSWITNNSNFDLKVVGYWNPVGSGSGSMFGYRRNQPSYDYLDTWLMLSTPKNQSGTVYVNGIEILGFDTYVNAAPLSISANPSLHRHMPAGVGRYNFQSLGRIDNSRVNAYEYNHGRIGNPGWGDEILVNVVVSGYSWVHFDAVGVDSEGRTHVNPYSHDASYYATPEPGTLGLLGLGLLGMIPVLRRKKD